MTRGLQLEIDLHNYCCYNSIASAISTHHEDKMKAIDLWIDGLPVQITLQSWDTTIQLLNLRAKVKHERTINKNTIIVVFHVNGSKLAMFKHMVCMLHAMGKKGITHGTLLIDNEKATYLRD